MAHKVTAEYTKVDGGNSNIKVSIRGRPPEDKSALTDFIEITQSEEEGEGGKILIKDPSGNTAKKHGEVSFQFDNIFWTEATQDEVFRSTCKIQVDHVMEGYSCCCFACKETIAITNMTSSIILLTSYFLQLQMVRLAVVKRTPCLVQKGERSRKVKSEGSCRAQLNISSKAWPSEQQPMRSPWSFLS